MFSRSDPISKQRCGQAAEQLACSHLEQHGLRLLAKNWRCRRGEIDLIMLDQNILVFVEVRYRQYPAWGGALASVDQRKREKLAITAQLFLQKETRWNRYPCRFDVVAIDPDKADHALRLNWLKNAFDC